MKARGTLLMVLLNKDQLKLHSYKEVKLLMEAIKKRHGETRNPRKFIELYSSNNMRTLQDQVQRQWIKLLIGSSSTSQNPQNVAFVSSNSTNSNSSTNEVDNTAYGVSAAHTQSNPTSGDNLSDAVIHAFLASQPNSPQLSQEDLEQINPDDLEEMDTKWEMAMLTIRSRRFIKRT
ncbi:hypothetical protein Tco_1005935 [Tanacetum coccineum]|uniref:Uncharacterized protein n=1 Tax=Tanacetum coccineum TaxID=301880 RepID=A0ABQ5FGK7_9ASTR